MNDIDSTSPFQTPVAHHDGGRVMAMDSAYHVHPSNRGIDVVVNASYCGVLPARFIAECSPRGAIGVDCGIGKEGAGIAGLWYLEALDIPAAVADVLTVELGNGIDLFKRGIISRLNEPARARGLHEGDPVAVAAAAMFSAATTRAASEVTNRQVAHTNAAGRSIILTDSIAFGLPEDRDHNVLCTAGHTGRSAFPYLRDVRPWGFICSDGGRGRDDSGMAALSMCDKIELAGATVSAASARMGDSSSTYNDGIISACNLKAASQGVRVGQTAQLAALALLG